MNTSPTTPITLKDGSEIEMKADWLHMRLAKGEVLSKMYFGAPAQAIFDTIVSDREEIGTLGDALNWLWESFTERDRQGLRKKIEDDESAMGRLLRERFASHTDATQPTNQNENGEKNDV